MNTLLPCPFCGCAEMDTLNESGVFMNKFGFTARCGDPDCGAEICGKSIAATQSKWNTQTELAEARAEISRLESVIADRRSFNFYLRKERDTLRADYSALREKHDKLSTENAPLRADAARYRWLRDNSLNNPNLRIKYRAANSDWTSISEIGELDSVIDSGIDAAHAQAEKEGLVKNMAVVENMAVV